MAIRPTRPAPLAPNMGLKAATLRAMQQGIGAESSLAALAEERKRAQALRETDMPEIGRAGDVYMASNPMSFLGALGKRIEGYQQGKDLKSQAEALRGQVTAGKQAQLEGDLQKAQAAEQARRAELLYGDEMTDWRTAQANEQARKAAEAKAQNAAIEAQIDREHDLLKLDREQGYKNAKQTGSKELMTMVDNNGQTHSVLFDPYGGQSTYADGSPLPAAAKYWQEAAPHRATAVTSDKAKPVVPFYDPNNPDVPINAMQIGDKYFDPDTQERLNVQGLRPWKDRPEALMSNDEKKALRTERETRYNEQAATDQFMRVISSPYAKTGLAGLGSRTLTGKAAEYGVFPERWGFEPESGSGYTDEEVSGGRALRKMAAGFNLEYVAPVLERLKLAPMSDTDLKKVMATAPKQDDGVDTWISWAEQNYIPMWEAKVRAAGDNPEAQEYVDNLKASVIIAKLNNGLYKAADDIPDSEADFLTKWERERGRGE